MRSVVVMEGSHMEESVLWVKGRAGYIVREYYILQTPLQGVLGPQDQQE